VGVILERDRCISGEGWVPKQRGMGGKLEGWVAKRRGMVAIWRGMGG
jgi:hypothetical protein